MALIKCSECGNQVSDKATTCPHCGAPVEVTPVATAPADESVSVLQSFDAEKYKNGGGAEYTLSGKEKKKESVLSNVSVGLAGGAIFLALFAIPSIICGIIDLCMWDKDKKHVGSIVALVISGFCLLAWIGRLL